MWFDLALVAGGAFLGALVVGSAGFAFAIIVTGIWLYVLPPAEAVLLASICATLLHSLSVWAFRTEIDYRRLWPFLAGGLLGVPLGVLALRNVDAAAFRHLFGAFMIIYASYALSRRRLPIVRFAPGCGRFADAIVGWVSGVMGGLALLHGALPTIWCGLRGWDTPQPLCLPAVHSVYRGFGDGRRRAERPGTGTPRRGLARSLPAGNDRRHVARAARLRLD
ncbi:MAG: TSUP family transporter [Betaproteobacteria bacterium]|nr:TSUP family transporter [Betaproteobacteria bacterium]